MSNIAIRVQNLGKWYELGADSKQIANNFRSRLTRALAAPFNSRQEPIPETGQPAAGPVEGGAKIHDSFVWALRDVSFEIEQGDVVGLIGPNGAGKSTLLKILARITTPTTGSADIYGHVNSLLEVGTGFHRELSGRDNVYLNGSILGMKKQEIDSKFDEIVTFSEIEKYIDTMVKYYSSGMSVRLAFAIAAHLEPEILLVDEVLAVGDAAFQKKCLSKMESVGKSGRTIIFVSHHLSSITRLCETAMLLDHGTLITRGASEDVVAHYLTHNLGLDAYREWPDPSAAPGDDVVRLRSVRVIDEEGSTSYSIDIRRPVGIELTYDVLRPGQKVVPYFSLLNSRDMIVFTSGENDENWRSAPRPVGRYTSVAWIPGNLLAEGDLRVSAAVGSEDRDLLHVEDVEAAAFQVIDSPDGDSARMDHAGGIRGVIRPYMSWQTEYDAA